MLSSTWLTRSQHALPNNRPSPGVLHTRPPRSDSPRHVLLCKHFLQRVPETVPLGRALRRFGAPVPNTPFLTTDHRPVFCTPALPDWAARATGCTWSRSARARRRPTRRPWTSSSCRTRRPSTRAPSAWTGPRPPSTTARRTRRRIPPRPTSGSCVRTSARSLTLLLHCRQPFRPAPPQPIFPTAVPTTTTTTTTTTLHLLPSPPRACLADTEGGYSVLGASVR